MLFLCLILLIFLVKVTLFCALQQGNRNTDVYRKLTEIYGAASDAYKRRGRWVYDRSWMTRHVGDTTGAAAAAEGSAGGLRLVRLTDHFPAFPLRMDA